LPPGWTPTGGSWIFGGTTGSSVLICPPECSLFARSGAPGIDEALVGTPTSAALTVDVESIPWLAADAAGKPAMA